MAWRYAALVGIQTHCMAGAGEDIGSVPELLLAHAKVPLQEEVPQLCTWFVVRICARCISIPAAMGNSLHPERRLSILAFYRMEHGRTQYHQPGDHVQRRHKIVKELVPRPGKDCDIGKTETDNRIKLPERTNTSAFLF